MKKNRTTIVDRAKDAERLSVGVVIGACITIVSFLMILGVYHPHSAESTSTLKSVIYLVLGMTCVWLCGRLWRKCGYPNLDLRDVEVELTRMHRASDRLKPEDLRESITGIQKKLGLSQSS